MGTVEIRPGENKTSQGENLEATADTEETTLKAASASALVQERSQGPPPVPWHILFPPGHPMHGAGRA